MICVLKYQVSHWYGIVLATQAKLEQNCGSYFLRSRVSKIVDSLGEKVENIFLRGYFPSLQVTLNRNGC